MQLSVDSHLVETLKPYQSFTSIDEMENHINRFTKNHPLSETMVRILRFLSGRSKLVLGACWLKIETIAKAKIVNCSESTVRRAIKELVKLGILQVHPQMRKMMGGSGANIYVLVPLDVEENTPENTPDDRAFDRAQMTGRGHAETPDVPRNEGPFFDPEKVSSKKDNKNDLDKERKLRTDDLPLNTTSLDKSFTSDRVPANFRDLVGCYFDDAEFITHLWNRTVLAAKMHYDSATVRVEMAIHAFKQCVLQYKRGKIRKGFAGYFFGVLREIFIQETRREAMEERIVDHVQREFGWSGWGEVTVYQAREIARLALSINSFDAIGMISNVCEEIRLEYGDDVNNPVEVLLNALESVE